MPIALAIPADEIQAQVHSALLEDVGAGDLTAALIPEDAEAHAAVISREEAILCGKPWFDEVFRQLDTRVQVEWQAEDGMQVAPGVLLCRLRGPARALLTGERTALNFLQTLSGTATLTRRYAQAVANTGARILDTRKTVPGLRKAQKYAVRCGGGHNHRMGLYDAVLIKENHIAAAGSITAAIRTARTCAPTGVMMEVEVENLNELDEALAAGADRILLDNMDIDSLNQAVKLTAKKAALECSGNVTLENIREIAATGIDYISVGALTKHVRAVDLSMRFLPSP